MLYHYEDPGYAKYGNHSDNGYNEYESYSNYAEPDHHQEPKPTPSEPNHHNYDHTTDLTKYNHHANCEYDADDANQEANETYEAYQPRSGYGGDETQELKELTHDGDGTDWEGEYEGSKVHKHKEPAYEPERDTEASYALSCGKLVSTGMIVLFMKESFPVCSGWGEVLC